MGPGPAPSSSTQLALDDAADRALASRGGWGPFAYTCAMLLFDAFSGVWREAPRTTAALTFVMVVTAAVRRWLNDRNRWMTRLTQARWRRLYAATTLAMGATFSAYVCVHIVVFGLGQPQALLLTTLATFVAGAAHALSPRVAFARALTLVLLLPPILVMAAVPSPWRPLFVPLLTVYLVHSLTFGTTLHREYWQAATSTASLADRTQELDRSRRQLQQLLENMPDAVLLLRGPQVAFTNAACCRLLGRPVGDVVGQPLSGFVHDSDAAALDEFLHAPGGPERNTRDIRFTGLDRAVLTWELLPGQPFEMDGHGVNLIVARDVTERNRMRDRLALSERLVTVGTLAAGMAHEINNPLTYVTLNLDHIIEALRAGTSSGAAQELLDVASEARDGAARVQAIVHELKDFYGAKGPVTTSADVHAVLTRALRMAQVETRHRAQMKLDLGKVPRVLGDEGKLGQVFLNLLINAAQAIPEGRAERNEIRVSTGLEPNGSVTVRITDTGCGIPEEVLPRIFDPFFTTKAVGGGTGLGLSVVHSALRAMGGDIAVTSEAGKGSSFTVRLSADRNALGTTSRPPDPLPPSGPRARVLVVDDEVVLSRAIQRVLRDRADVVCEDNARAALARLRAGEAFDLILCDLMMPDLTGMDVYETLGEMQPDYRARVVFMTGGAFTDRARAFLAHVPNRVLNKPTSPAILRALLP